MGEGTSGRDLEEPSADELAQRVERSRERLDTLVEELDQRRHVLVRFKDTLTRHKLWTTAAGVLVLAAVATAVQLTLRHQRKQRTLRARVSRWTHALGRALAKPERVARSEPNVASKVLSTAASSLTGMLVKRAGSRALAAPERGREPGYFKNRS
jgi:hypothetical protein